MDVDAAFGLRCAVEHDLLVTDFRGVTGYRLADYSMICSAGRLMMTTPTFQTHLTDKASLISLAIHPLLLFLIPISSSYILHS